MTFRKNVPIFLLGAILSLALSGCQLLYLPFYAVNLTFSLLSQLLNMAIILPIRLLPVVIKYAPLALLFLEKTPSEPVYYVEWLEKNSYTYRVEEFVDMDGRLIAAVAAPSTALDRWLREAGTENDHTATILLTDATHKQVSREDLRNAWETLKSKPGAVWLSGERVKEFQSTQDGIYV